MCVNLPPQGSPFSLCRVLALFSKIMKKIITIVSAAVISCFIFSFLVPTVSAAPSKKIKEILVCNTSVREISTLPGEHVMLAGFAARHKLSSGETHIPLYSHALVIGRAQWNVKTKSIVKKNGVPQITDKTLIITNDLMEISIDEANILADSISVLTGLSKEKIFIHCIHTHSAPRSMLSYWADPGKPNHDYAIRCEEHIIANAVQAVKDAAAFQPFTIEFGEGASNININRGEKDGPIDRTVFAAKFLNTITGKPIVSLINYSCHPVSLGPGSQVTSSDFPGVVMRELKDAWGCDIFYYSGAQGNVDPAGCPQSKVEVTEKIGKQMANDILAIKFCKMPAANFCGKNLTLKIVHNEIKLPFQVEKITEDAINHLADSTSKWGVSVSQTWKDDVEGWRKGEIEKLRSGKTKDYLPFEVAAVNVGGFVMFFTQGEPFNEYQSGLRKEFAGTPLMFIAYTNGQNSYLPSAHAYTVKAYDYEKDQMHVYIHSPYPLSSKMTTTYEKGIAETVKQVLK